MMNKLPQMPLYEIILSHPEGDERSWELFALGVGGIESIDATTFKFYSERSSEEIATIITEAQARGFTLVGKNEVKKENWVTKFEELLTPFEVGKLTIQPVKDIEEGKQYPSIPSRVTLIPGMGFGTGHHPTTRMLLEFMQDTSVISSAPQFVLDVGTGSGILALGLAKLFPATPIRAFDNDPVAIDNAEENSQFNTPHNITFAIEELQTSYTQQPDLIIANIYAEVLIHLEPQFRKLLIHQGRALLSGITKEASTSLREHFLSNGWQVIKEELRGEWYAVAVEKK